MQKSLASLINDIYGNDYYCQAVSMNKVFILSDYSKLDKILPLSKSINRIVVVIEWLFKFVASSMLLFQSIVTFFNQSSNAGLKVVAFRTIKSPSWTISVYERLFAYIIIMMKLSGYHIKSSGIT